MLRPAHSPGWREMELEMAVDPHEIGGLISAQVISRVIIPPAFQDVDAVPAVEIDQILFGAWAAAALHSDPRQGVSEDVVRFQCAAALVAHENAPRSVEDAVLLAGRVSVVSDLQAGPRILVN